VFIREALIERQPFHLRTHSLKHVFNVEKVRRAIALLLSAVGKKSFGSFRFASASHMACRRVRLCRETRGLFLPQRLVFCFSFFVQTAMLCSNGISVTWRFEMTKH